MISREEFNQVRDFAQGLKALVIGDVMLDKYIYGVVERISPEAPVPILNHQHTDIKPGGAANVAINLAAWGCETSIIGLVGQDDQASVLENLMLEHEIKPFWIAGKDRPTTLKTRVVASSHHLLRIDEESSAYLVGAEEKEAMDRISELLSSLQPELVIIEDYNKGLLTASIIQMILDYCTLHNVFVAVDPKEQHFFKYQHIQLFKPNLREAGLAHHGSIAKNDLPAISEAWRGQQSIETLAITLGAQGIYLHGKEGGYQVLPDRAIDVVDVCGAGDAVVVALALGLRSGLSGQKSASLGNLAGAYVCSHSGVVAVRLDEIYEWI